MEGFIDLIIRFLAALLLIVGSFLGKKAMEWLKSKLDQAENEKLDKLIDDFTMAAEQMLKEFDDDGSARLDYVYENLVEAGYEITEAIRAKIESRVFRINKGGVAS